MSDSIWLEAGIALNWLTNLNLIETNFDGKSHKSYKLEKT